MFFYKYFGMLSFLFPSFSFAFFLFTICFFSVNIFLSTFFNFLLPKFILKRQHSYICCLKLLIPPLKNPFNMTIFNNWGTIYWYFWKWKMSWVIVWRKRQKSETDCETIAAHHVRFLLLSFLCLFIFICVWVCVYGCVCKGVCEVKWEWELELVYF